MSEPAPPPDLAHRSDIPIPLLVARGGIGGALMGLANLVPGISGGTMLLAAGVYPGFIAAIAELTTLRFRPRSIVLLGSIAIAAALAILLLAGLMRGLVIEQRWIMYSLFIGLTLGGVPLVWRLARPATTGVWVGAAAAFVLMLVMAFVGAREPGSAQANLPLLVISGLAGASAMILPGVSGGYLLLLLGQYEPILGAIDQLKEGVLASSGPDIAEIFDALWVVAPVGIGVVIGIVGVSNLVKWLLEHHRKPTLGALLGLLFGAVVGLWPFQQATPPQPGDRVDGRLVRAEEIAEIEIDDWPVETFRPSAAHVGASLALVLAGFGATLLVARIGPGEEEEAGSE